MVFSEYLPMRYQLATMRSHASFITRGRLSIVEIIIAVHSEKTCAGLLPTHNFIADLKRQTNDIAMFSITLC